MVLNMFFCNIRPSVHSPLIKYLAASFRNFTVVVEKIFCIRIGGGMGKARGGVGEAGGWGGYLDYLAVLEPTMTWPGIV